MELKLKFAYQVHAAVHGGWLSQVKVMSVLADFSEWGRVQWIMFGFTRELNDARCGPFADNQGPSYGPDRTGAKH